MDEDLVELHDVDVLGDTGLTVVCSIAGRRVLVPTLQIHPRSTARRPGDHGTLVVPRWLAQNLGLV